MYKRVEFTVKGKKIQRAGYRDTVYDIALELGIKGSVENLPNGNVYVIAEGEEEILKEFVKRIDIKSVEKKEGEISPTTSLIEVESIEGKDNFKEPKKEFDSFKVLYKSSKERYDEEILQSLGTAKHYLDTFRQESSHNFNVLDHKYGKISGEIVGTRSDIKDSFNDLHKDFRILIYVLILLAIGFFFIFIFKS